MPALDLDALRAALTLDPDGLPQEFLTLRRVVQSLSRGLEAAATVHPAPWELSESASRDSCRVTDGTGASVMLIDDADAAISAVGQFNLGVAVAGYVRSTMEEAF